MIAAEDFERRIAYGGEYHEAYQAELFAQWAKQRARQEVAGGASSGWLKRIDVMTLADPAPPSMFLRANTNGTWRGYGYPGGLHLLYGARKSGKTFLAYLWAAQVLNAGGAVLWFAFERQQGVRERLALAGARDLTRFDYREASGMPGAAQVQALAAEITVNGVSLVVFDAMRGLQAAVAPGTSANDGDDVELVNSRILVPFQRAGAAVLVIDHTAKNGGGASAFGSERKESMADVVLSVDCKRQFSRESEGWSVVTATADRYGYNDEDSPGYLVMVPGCGIQFREDIPVTVASVIAEDVTAVRMKAEAHKARDLTVYEAVLKRDDWTVNGLGNFLAAERAGGPFALKQAQWRAHIDGMLMSGRLRAAPGQRNARLLRPGAGALPAEVGQLAAEPGVAARLARYERDLTVY